MMHTTTFSSCTFAQNMKAVEIWGLSQARGLIDLPLGMARRTQLALLQLTLRPYIFENWTPRTLNIAASQVRTWYNECSCAHSFWDTRGNKLPRPTRT